jgi:hypothetical protein
VPPTVWRNLALARFNKSGCLGDLSFSRLGQVTSPNNQTTKQLNDQEVALDNNHQGIRQFRTLIDSNL